MKISDLISNDPQAIFTALTLLREDMDFLKYMNEHLLTSDASDLWILFKNLNEIEINSFYISHPKSRILFSVEIFRKLVKNYETDRSDSNKGS